MSALTAASGRPELIGFEGGREGRCMLMIDGELERIGPSELVASAAFGELPTDDQQRVHWIAARQFGGQEGAR